ncbi:MAG: DUF427 domain-containing protein [Bacteroidota bacterium]
MTFRRQSPKPGQESVWDYPRPPRLESVSESIQIWMGQLLLASTSQAVRILETSHPPVYYLPEADIEMQFLQPSPGKRSYCEFKGQAHYVDFVYEDHYLPQIGWGYRHPDKKYPQLAGRLAFYASRVTKAMVGDEVVQAQEGDFYGGWITSKIVGPFKGGPGTWGW